MTELWRPDQPEYDSLIEFLALAGDFPSYLVWPLPTGWLVSDFAIARDDEGRVTGTLVGLTGLSDIDGPVDVVVVIEEPGAGLGSRCADLDRSDPGSELGDGAPSARVRVEGKAAPLWSVTPTGREMRADELFGEWDRSVVVGELQGRWLWIVVRPASAVLLLQDDWSLRQLDTLGISLVELPFGDPGSAW